MIRNEAICRCFELIVFHIVTKVLTKATKVFYSKAINVVILNII